MAAMASFSMVVEKFRPGATDRIYELFEPWIAAWQDLVESDVVPVQSPQAAATTTE